MCSHSVACGTADENAAGNAIGYPMFRWASHAAVIRVYDEAVNVIATHAHRAS
jgi:hypothetical protein